MKDKSYSRELTQEEFDAFCKYLSQKIGYWNAVKLTNGWNLLTNGEYVWVKDEEWDDNCVWHWDEIYENNENSIFY